MHQEKTIQKTSTKTRQDEFAEQYISLRQQEGRLYTDDEVMHLPQYVSSGPAGKEWAIRKATCKRFRKYLAMKNRSLKILEVGCGNGWFSHNLSMLSNVFVVGMDINLLELNQASRVFSKKSNLDFIYGDPRFGQGNEKFDVIVFASSIQYFPSFSEIMQAAQNLLNESGEVHLLDTHIYKSSEVLEARQRSASYFKHLGLEKMARFYFHHSFEDLKNLNYRVLYNPRLFLNRFLKANPFHWICLKA